MVANSRRGRTIEAFQGLVVILGIPIGVVPLVRWIANGDHGGLFQWLLGAPSGAMGLVAPLLVIGVGIAIIAILEVVKKRGS